MAEPEIVEDFHGVYLLYNINPRYKGRTYIGYTRDANRRIMQHNRGVWAGGAYRTSNKGPWKMVLIVHGFPNNISALRFEWAWQNPDKTVRLQHLNLKKMPRKESEYQFKHRVLSEMLRVGPWCRLPLMIRWLENEYRQEFSLERKPPDHMSIIQGPVKSYNHKKPKPITSIPTIECLLCSGYLNDTEKVTCTNENCELVSHIACLANLFLPPGEYIPIYGYCPFCNTKLKWGDLIKKMNGFDQGKDDKLEGDDNNVCTDDEDFGDMICSQNVDPDDVVCPQNNYNKPSQDRVFVDNFEDDDVICTQSRDDDLVCTQDNGDDVSKWRKVITGNEMCTENENKIVDNGSDDSDNEVLFKRKTDYNDQPSWFLDCNENL